MHVTAVRRAQVIEQPVQRGYLAQVEQLELRHDPSGLGARVQLTHERPRVGEHLVPKLTVPQVNEHASGSAPSTASRSAKLSVTATPVDNGMIRSVLSRALAR